MRLVRANCGVLSVKCQVPLPIADEIVMRDLRSSLGLTVFRTVRDIRLVEADYFREGDALVQVCTRNRRAHVSFDKESAGAK